jgi:capsular exopolysaccharide synthesis family protein
MTHRDDSSPAPEHAQAMIGGTHPGDALVAQSNGVPTAVGYPVTPPQPAQNVLRGGMDVAWFLHSLRRRWLLALCMGSVAGALTALGLWVYFPESTSAEAIFQVYSQRPTLVFKDAMPNESKDFSILQRTQVALLKSYFVLQSAVRDPGIASMSILANTGSEDPVQWLANELNVNFLQGSEILRVSLSSDAPADEIRLLVEAIAKAYDKEVIYAEKQRRLSTRDALAKSLGQVNREYQNKLENYHSLALDLGSPEAYGTDPETSLLLHSVREKTKSLTDLEGQRAAKHVQFLIMQTRLKDPQLLDQEVEQAMMVDPTASSLQMELAAAQSELAQKSALLKRRTKDTMRLEQKISDIGRQLEVYKSRMKQQIRSQEKSKPNMALQAITKEYQIELGVLGQQIAGLQKQIDEDTERLHQKAEKSTDLAIQRTELDQLAVIAKDMSIKLESIDIEAEAPERIRFIPPVVVTPGINRAQRYAIAGLGGIGMFSLVCFGIGYLEFRNRRLNGPDQVDEGLGIRVVGTLPALSARKLLDPNHPVVAQLTESIDGVRTLLMHDSTSKQRQVVMVSSAVAMEGRTTVASQLAASLARAGRRTLLVDADLRRPALHALFDVPLEDGLCEVLRAEVDVTDVIRPTHAEGLWLLTAGYCDVDAIHALATEQLQPVFEKLRAEYDFIVLDGAPVLGMSDALICGQYCDGVILSVRRDFSAMPKINEAAQLLRGVGIRLVGAVVNGVASSSDGRVTELRFITPKADRQQLEAQAT